MRTRTIKRKRRYVAPYWLVVTRPLMRYSASRDAYVLRAVGQHFGPVLRADRRRSSRASGPLDGAERRRARVA
jgi:hypothetical protein